MDVMGMTMEGLSRQVYNRAEDHKWSDVLAAARELARRKEEREVDYSEAIKGFTSTEGIETAIRAAWSQDNWDRVARLAERAMELEKEAEEGKRLLEKLTKLQGLGAEFLIRVYTDSVGVGLSREGRGFYGRLRQDSLFAFRFPVQVDVRRVEALPRFDAPDRVLINAEFC